MMNKILAISLTVCVSSSLTLLGVVAVKGWYTVERAQHEFESNRENYIYNWDGWRKDGKLKCQGDEALRVCTLLDEITDPETGRVGNRLRIIACSTYECQWVL